MRLWGSVGSAITAVLVSSACGRPGEISAREHWVERGPYRLNLFEKVQGSAERPAQTGRVILLLHGATWPSRPNFDLPAADYSMMDVLAEAGYDVFALDVHGYGRSATAIADPDWSNTESATADVAAAVEYIIELRGVPRVHILGWSWGSLTGGLYAMRHPERVARLILYAPVWKGTPELRATPSPSSPYRENTAAAATADFISGQADPRIVELYAAEALREAPRSPNGVFADLAGLPILSPEAINVPTLIIHGEHDWLAREADLVPFFAELGTKDKAYVVLPAGGHLIMLEAGRSRFRRSVLSFLEGGYFE